jgi:hypothetical protein
VRLRLCSQAARYAAHTSFLINSTHIEGTPINAAVVWRFFATATKAWANGTLGMQASIPLLFWVFGAVWLPLATAALLLALRLLDWGEFEDVLSSSDNVSLRMQLHGEGEASTRPLAHSLAQSGQLAFRWWGWPDRRSQAVRQAAERSSTFLV